MVWIAITIALAALAGAGAAAALGRAGLAGRPRAAEPDPLRDRPAGDVPEPGGPAADRRRSASGSCSGGSRWDCAGAVAYVVARRLALDRPATGSLINVALQGNTGYVGLPLTAAFLGTEELSGAVAYDALIQGPALLVGVFGVGAAFGTKAGTGVRERTGTFLRRNPPLVAAILGLVAPAAMAPDALVDASRVVVFAMLPLGFFGVGVALAEAGGRRALLPPFTRPLAAAIGLRLVLAPALLGLLAWPLRRPARRLPADGRDAPPASTGLVVAHAYGLDMRFSAAAIAWTTVVSVLAALAAAVVL